MHTSVDENVSDDSDKVDEQEETNTVMNRYGLDGPEDKLEKGLWKCLRIMFEEPLSTDSIWSEIEQQKIVNPVYNSLKRFGDKDSLGDDASKQGRIDIGDINTDAEITLIDETQGRINDIIADEDITLIS
ncbi:hypothetical protein Tco_0349678 [Tanacetum coccineum]